jgi:hypothetical protein
MTVLGSKRFGSLSWRIKRAQFGYGECGLGDDAARVAPVVKRWPFGRRYLTPYGRLGIDARAVKLRQTVHLRNIFIPVSSEPLHFFEVPRIVL